MRHPQYVKSSEYYHIECASLLSQAQRRALNLTQEDYDNLAELKAECQAKLSDDNPAKITKRTQSSDGVYYIIALDHLDDMSPRALAGSIYQDEEDGTLSTSLDAFSEVGFHLLPGVKDGISDNEPCFTFRALKTRSGALNWHKGHGTVYFMMMGHLGLNIISLHLVIRSLLLLDIEGGPFLLCRGFCVYGHSLSTFHSSVSTLSLVYLKRSWSLFCLPAQNSTSIGVMV